MQIVMKFLPRVITEKLKRFMLWRYRKFLAGKTVEEVFTGIYEKGVWGTKNIRSGGGSTVEHTIEIIQLLPGLFKRYQIKSILDLPCGDFSWMQNMELSAIQYIGGDIVEQLIKRNIENYAQPNRSFTKLDIVKDPLPVGIDLILCRDCFVHLSNQHIRQSIDNIRSSGARYLLVTSFTKTTENTDILTGEWRRINMELPPFNLKPIEILNERCPEADGKFADKSLLLIDLHAR